MTIVSSLALFVMIVIPASLHAQTLGICPGPVTDFISFVGQKQENPPEIELIPGTKNEQPCKSSVAKSVANKPSWQLLETKKAIKVDLDNKGTIVALEIVNKSFVPSFKKDAARKMGLDIE